MNATPTCRNDCVASGRSSQPFAQACRALRTARTHREPLVIPSRRKAGRKYRGSALPPANHFRRRSKVSGIPRGPTIWRQGRDVRLAKRLLLFFSLSSGRRQFGDLEIGKQEHVVRRNSHVSGDLSGEWLAGDFHGFLHSIRPPGDWGCSMGKPAYQGINRPLARRAGSVRQTHLRSSSSTTMADANGRMNSHTRKEIGVVPKSALPHGV